MATVSPSAMLVPGPPAARLLGWRGQSIKFLRDPVGFMRALYLDHGRLAAWMQGNPWWMFAFGPEYNQQILADAAHFHSIPIAPLATPPDSALSRLTRNLLSMNGAQHKQQRRLVLPAFHKRRVEAYRDDMAAIAQRFLDRWRPGQPLDLAREMQQLTLCIASHVLFGVDASQEAGSVGRLIHRWMGLLESVGVFLLPKRWPGTPFSRLLALSEQLEARILAMIAQKRAAASRQQDVLAMLIHARDEDGVAMTNVDLIGQASLIFVAGHETSSNALTWTLFLLSQHPRVLHDLLDELEGALRGDAPTVEQLRPEASALPLLEAVIKESMRLLPPATFAIRTSATPFQLGPYDLPAGATVTISPYITHHMPELYPKPERFLPERWTAIDPSTYEYIPFGAGPHMCIGATFAMMEIKIVLALLLQRYRLAIRPGARIDRRVKITMSPKYGMPVIVAPQDRQFVKSKASVRGNIHEMVELA